MTADAEIPKGYKLTEVGVIPEDWQVHALGEIGKFKNGLNKDSAAFGHGAPFVNLMDVFGVYSISTCEDLGLVACSSFERASYDLRRGDVIFVRSSVKPSGVGLTAVVVHDLPGTVYSGFLIRFRDSGFIDLGYKKYCFNEGTFRRAVIGNSSVSANTNINQNSLKRLAIALPPTRAEQEAIAEALSDSDALIESLEQLLAKKRQVKQGAMQELLTGKKRLPGFSGEWAVKRLGDHVSFLRHGVNSRSELMAEGSVKYLHYGDIHTATDVYLDPCTSQMPRLPIDRARALDRLQDGDLVLVDASEDLEGVGKSVEVKGVRGEEVVSGLHTIAARFDKTVLADGFKAYLQFCPTFRGHLRRLAAGTKVYATNRTHIATLEISLPDIEEQTAIAAILSDMDAEIAALEAKLAKARSLKQGMMQELLTGRIRLV